VFFFILEKGGGGGGEQQHVFERIAVLFSNFSWKTKIVGLLQFISWHFHRLMGPPFSFDYFFLLL